MSFWDLQQMPVPDVPVDQPVGGWIAGISGAA
jgi:hypothetical protein